MLPEPMTATLMGSDMESHHSFGMEIVVSSEISDDVRNIEQDEVRVCQAEDHLPFRCRAGIHESCHD